jgi:hypothetical protein
MQLVEVTVRYGYEGGEQPHADNADLADLG